MLIGAGLPLVNVYLKDKPVPATEKMSFQLVKLFNIK